MAIDTLAVDSSVNSTLPLCPDHYNSFTIYRAGDTIEDNLVIYQCQGPPYEEYCSINEIGDGWNDTEASLWWDAWARVGACVRDAADAGTGEVDGDIAISEVAEATSDAGMEANATADLAHCPPAYDTSKIDYAAGDQVTIRSNIFKCRDEAHETYCNIPVWDDSLLDNDVSAKDMWVHAWEKLGACELATSELAANDTGADEDS